MVSTKFIGLHRALAVIVLASLLCTDWTAFCPEKGGQSNNSIPDINTDQNHCL